jgi:predicted Zn finger-like uncharacterized protein
MLVTCPKCDARLQVDESKLPSHSIKVRCPKCQSGIDVPPATVEQNPNAISPPVDMAPPSTRSPFELPIAAARFKPAESDKPAESRDDDRMQSSEVAKLLAAALRQAEPRAKLSGVDGRPTWERRKALVCTNEHREVIAHGLVAQNFEVFIAENTAEALGRMREDQIDVLILDSDFDPLEQGFAFVSREVKLMRPAQRRRLFLTFLTPTVRSMDLHAAFLNNVNLVVNPADVERLPEVLEVSMRHFNDLYRDFNRALEMPAL